MSYTAQKANRVLTIAEEKAEEYAKMGYVISNESGEMVIEPENLERKVAELEAKLKEATLYAENADKKIEELQAENAELKAALQAQSTMGAVVPDAPASRNKTTKKTTKKTDQEA